MSNAYKSMYERISTMSAKRADFVALEDGYYYFMPNPPIGAISAAELRILADILDEKNKAWDTQVRKELGGGA